MCHIPDKDMRSLFRKYSFIIILSAILPLFSGCSTGVEGTKTIRMTKTERRELMPSAEQVFVADMKSDPLSDWQQGKRFLVSDEKAAVVLRSTDGSSDNLKGAVLIYNKVESRRTPAGAEEAVILFSGNGRELRYSTGRSIADSYKELTASDVPMLIDLDLVDKALRLLTGKKVWTMSNLWYDADGNIARGVKYVPVTITGVQPGDKVFPLLVSFKDASGSEFGMWMSVRNDGNQASAGASRWFGNLFSLSDPRLGHQEIDDAVWELICTGKVREGMTKEECRLSLGNPDEVDSGHDWNSTLDIWRYQNGTFLRFQDGKLANFRN